MNDHHMIPARITEIMISKICHDLVSPVGAVNNGIEFLSDVGAEGLEDGLGLMEHSARQASVRLQLFRMCYGAGGSDAKVTGKMIYETFQNYIAGTKTQLEWDLMNDMPDQDLPAGFMKTLLNMFVFAHESIPKGGLVQVTYNDNAMIVKAQGDLVKPKDGSFEALVNDVDAGDIDPKSVHGYITRAYASQYGFKLGATMSDSDVIVSLDIP
jgi:histidine phosphotransferase ChpT